MKISQHASAMNFYEPIIHLQCHQYFCLSPSLFLLFGWSILKQTSDFMSFYNKVLQCLSRPQKKGHFLT